MYLYSEPQTQCKQLKVKTTQVQLKVQAHVDKTGVQYRGNSQVGLFNLNSSRQIPAHTESV